jgi:hypothetical protein
MIEGQEDFSEAIILFQEFLHYQNPPYPPLKIPPYRQGQHGQWMLDQFDAPIVRGYFTGLQPARSNHRLRKGKTIWMSLTPMELESQSHHALAACGHTVVMGLGMGLLLYNILAREEVERVTVIERDPKVAELLHQIAEPTTWTGWEKVNIVIADALDWQPTEPVDYLTADIWEALGDENLRPDGQQIQRHVKADQVALWGQELDFVTYLIDRDCQTLPTLELYQEYLEAIGIPLIEADNPNYPDYCMRAARSVASY